MSISSSEIISAASDADVICAGGLNTAAVQTSSLRRRYRPKSQQVITSFE